MKNPNEQQRMKCDERTGDGTRESSLSIEDESCETYYTAMSRAVPNFETQSSFYIRSPKKVPSYV